MPNYTPNLNLKKPLTGEHYDVVADHNDAMDKIDKGIVIRVPRRSILEAGCKPTSEDAAFDNAPLINALVSSMTAGQTLYVPDASGFTIKDTVFIPGNINVEMHSIFNYDGPNDRPAIVYGVPNIRSNPKRLRFAVNNINQSNWSNEACIGLRIHNVQNCPDFKIDTASKFTIGIEAIGSGQGFVYNEIVVGQALGNKYAMVGTNENSGWFNENDINLLSVMQYTGVNTGLSRYGFKLSSKDMSYVNNNKNKVVASYELKNSEALPGESIPVILEHGTENKFIDSRDESNGNIFAKVMNDSAYNLFEVSYSTTSSILVDTSTSGYNSMIRSRSILQAHTPLSLIFDSGNLRQKTFNYNGNERYIQGLHIETSTLTSQRRSHTGITLGANFIEFAGARGIGRYINTEKVKTFIVRTDVIDGYEGRLAIRCYDAASNILNGATTTYLKYKPTTAITWFSSFGGVYRRGADGSNNIYFSVAEEVKYIDLMIIGGTSNCRIKSFKVYAVEQNDAATWCNYDDNLIGFTNEITNPPSFIGQIAVSGGNAYIAKGTSSAADWVVV